MRQDRHHASDCLDRGRLDRGGAADRVSLDEGINNQAAKIAVRVDNACSD
jgi:hypothetical protein